MGKLNPVEVAEISEELSNASKKYELDGHFLIAFRDGHVSFVGNMTIASLMAIAGPSLFKIFSDRMATK